MWNILSWEDREHLINVFFVMDHEGVGVAHKITSPTNQPQMTEQYCNKHEKLSKSCYGILNNEPFY